MATGTKHVDNADGASTMPFWEHLEALRWCFIWALIAVLVGAATSIAFSDRLLTFLLRPAARLGDSVRLVNLTPLSMVMVRLYIALLVGVIVGLPVIVERFWRFIAGGLYPEERHAAPLVLFSTMFLFALGAGLAYLMIPFLLQVLVQAGYQGVENTWNIREYIAFLLGFMAAFGIVFELPVVIYILSLLGIATPERLRRGRRYAIVLIVIVAAVFTPSPDPFSQLAMAVPLWVLFEASIFVSAMVKRRRDRRTADG